MHSTPTHTHPHTNHDLSRLSAVERAEAIKVVQMESPDYKPEAGFYADPAPNCYQTIYVLQVRGCACE